MKKLIKNFFKLIKKIIKVLTNPSTLARYRYSVFLKRPVKENTVLLESQQGREYNGNIFYLALELCNNPEFNKYDINFVLNKKKIEAGKKFFLTHGIEKKINIIKKNSKKYFKLLATSKYLIEDVTFLLYFQKRPEQIYLNTWHGTPLKTLGKKQKEDLYLIGNPIRNFCQADYLLFQNNFTKNVMCRDYFLDKLSVKTKYIISGYPRNTVFFNNTYKEQIVEKYNLHNKKMWAYLPTYRGLSRFGGTKSNDEILVQHLNTIDSLLADDELFFVNLHPISRKTIDFSVFKHIKQFPAEYETYEFLSCCDALVTDYSSVMFDFVTTKKKIVLFTYDKEEYLADRGMYLNIDDFPFPKVFEPSSLLNELRSSKTYDDTDFIKEYCPYDNKDASKQLLQQFLSGKEVCPETIKPETKNKQNIFIYAGNLANNGITRSIMNLINSIDTSKRNYFICYYQNKIIKQGKEKLLALPENIGFYPLCNQRNESLFLHGIDFLFNHRLISTNKYCRLMKETWKLDFQRLFGGIKVDGFIQFNGYEDQVLLEFSNFYLGEKRIPNAVYVHNNMVEEHKHKNNCRLQTLRKVYNSYDGLCPVTEDLIPSIEQIAGKNIKTYICPNIINYTYIKEKADEEIHFDLYTRSSIPEEEVFEALNSSDYKFINIGRFSWEKGQLELIRAFSKIHKENQKTKLFILGGNSYHNYRSKLEKEIKNLGLQSSVILITNVSNPYPFLKKCDGFVFSSHYEGFGLVVPEADILSKPIVSTDVCGIHGFMKANNGFLVKDSKEGLYEGMHKLLNNEIKLMNVDYEEYDKNAILCAEKMFGTLFC